MAEAWTDEQLIWLIINYPEKGQEYCAEYLNRSKSSIRAKTSRLKLKQNRNSDFFKNWQSKAAASKIGKKRPGQSLVMKKNHTDGKLLKNEKQKAAIGLRIKTWQKENGHPRGMKGKKHNPEAIEKISNSSKEHWLKPDIVQKSPEYLQKQSDRMSIRQSQGLMRNAYSRGKQGRRVDLDNIFFRSSWEANYARYLNFLKDKGIIFNWQFEPDTFWFEKIKRGVRSYLPDFKIWETELSTPYYIEVKGWMDDKSKTKLKRMAKYHPLIRVDLVTGKEYKEIKNKLSNLIPFWEL